jgi:hypothetical protein
MRSLTRFIFGVAVALILLPAAGAEASVAPLHSLALVAASASGAQNGVVSDVAYDDKHDVYLRVWDGSTYVWGRFVGTDGMPKGDPFVISEARAGYAGWVRVAYSSGSADDVFLVTYASDYAGNKNIFGQLVRYTGAGATAGTLVAPALPVASGLSAFAISEYSMYRGITQTPGEVVFNPLRRQFLVVWEDSRGGWDVVARLFSAAGAALTPDVNISRGSGAQGAPSAAYDWVNDRYLIVYHGTHPDYLFPELLGVWGKLVTGGTLDIVHAEATDGLIPILWGAHALESGVVFLPEAQAFTAFWTDFIGSNRNVEGRVVPSKFGDPGVGFATPIFPILASGLNEGAADATYNPATRTVLMASMWDPGPVIGIELGGATGQPVSGGFTLTSPAGGTFNPRVVTSESGQFGVAFITDYVTSWVQQFQGVLSSTPGPTPDGGAPPPPPPPPPSPPPPPPPAAPSMADVQVLPFNYNGDVLRDVLLYNRVTGGWKIQLGNLQGKFDAGPSGTWATGLRVYRADWDGAGLDDLFVYSETSGAWSKIINSGTSFTYFSQIWLSGFNITIADLNGDSRSDVFLYNPKSGAWYTAVSAGDGRAGFEYGGGGWLPGFSIFPADFDADGRTDFLLYHADSGLFFKAVTRGNGVFAYSGGGWARGWTPVVAELNGDGRSDVFLYNASNGLFYRATSAGDGTGGFTYQIGGWIPGWSVTAADFNGDILTDFLLYNQSNGSWFKVINQGTGFAYTSGGWSQWSTSVSRMNGDIIDDVLLYNQSSGLWYQAITTPSGFTYTTGQFPQ